MATAQFTLTCPTCGQEFEVRKTCRNTAEATRYKAWAEANPYDCPACYKAAKTAETAAKAAAVTAHVPMPEITGKSDKQIQYANDLRTKYLASDHPRIPYWDKLTATIRTGDFAQSVTRLSQKSDITLPDAVYQSLHRLGLDVLVILHATPDAGEIIDLLAHDRWNDELSPNDAEYTAWMSPLTVSAYYKLEAELKPAPTED